MRIQFFSDLHVDVAAVKPISVASDVDVVAVAGDVCEGARNAFVALRRIVPERIPIVAIAGNHEFYRRSLQEEIAAAREAAPDFNIMFAENDVVSVGSGAVRFLACTLWTDYRLFGDAKVALAMEAARHGMNDHRLISWRKRPWSRFRPEEALLLHRKSLQFLETALSAPIDAKVATVVMTHHLADRGSIDARFADDILTAAFASDLSDFLNSSGDDGERRSAKISLWNSAHTHSSSDYVAANGIRFLTNPHGYGNENPRFDPRLVVELGE